MGYIQNSQPEIFALRPAPVQINYLAYPGTLGASYIDYIIMDKMALSDEEEVLEKPIYMPASYFITDNKFAINISKKKSDYNLPDNKFIFASFNKQNKIDEEILDIWSEILRSKKDSILWIYSDNKIAEQNLVKEFNKRDIEPDRIYFMANENRESHLARIKLADICLDCMQVSAHTTAIDCLWSGNIIITLSLIHI